MPIRRLPPLHAVRAFEAAARHLSMSRAAEELAVTPGAVSRQVRELEERLDAVLFVRRPTGLALTAAGERLAAATSDALDRLAEATRGAKLRHYRQVSIGVYSQFASRLILPVWDDLRGALPDIPVTLHTSSNPLDLLPGQFDLVIAVSGAGGHRGLIERPLMPIATVPVCAPSLLANGPLDFAAVPLLHSRPRPDDWRRWLDHAGLSAVPVRGGSSFEGAALTLEAAAAGLGAAIAIEALLEPDLASGALAVAHPIRRPTRRGFVLAHETRLADDPSVVAVADWLGARLSRTGTEGAPR
jgi:LysR family transcriptional regulator, glycine cleavage system transcriptional activator